MPEIYQRIEQLCVQKGINITHLCSACSIPRATLSDYKNGRTKSLSADTLLKISEYFGVSVDYLYGKDNTPTDEKALKVALFGGEANVTDEMWNEVKRYAEYIKERENGNK
ncbi:MAG: helix-turn-helix transcriptional regulator [Clostridia bacterium]|nr:helix-turn-helix transcriptional regulator [Clostridia bacterium]